MAASVIKFLPYLAIGALVIGALFALYQAFKKAKEFFSIGDGGEGSASDMAAEAAGVGIGDENVVAEEGDMSSKVMRKGFHADTGGDKMEFIEPNDPRYDDLYMKKYGREAPKKGEVFIDGERKILPLTDDGKLIRDSNIMENKMSLKSPENLKPVDTSSDGKNQANIIDGSSTQNIKNDTYTNAGLESARNRDFELFHMAHPLYAD